MSDRINELIETIREKTSLLRNQIASEKARNEELTLEVQRLSQEVLLKDEALVGLTHKMSELNQSIESEKEQSSSSSDVTGVTDEQIDELVKEIEYCIVQLKK